MEAQMGKQRRRLLSDPLGLFFYLNQKYIVRKFDWFIFLLNMQKDVILKVLTLFFPQGVLVIWWEEHTGYVKLWTMLVQTKGTVTLI